MPGRVPVGHGATPGTGIAVLGRHNLVSHPGKCYLQNIVVMVEAVTVFNCLSVSA